MIMINLFSIFDPITSINFSLNWLIRIFLILFCPIIYWFIPSRWRMFFQLIINFFFKEFKVLIKKKLNLINLLIFIRMFFFIIINNVLGIFSYMFTSTRHLVVTLRFAIRLWVSYILYGWVNNTNIIFAHCVPLGTPKLLIIFIVLIETIRNLIRPITLAIRLSANIIAGHLLLTLISSACCKLTMFRGIIILIGQIVLIILELSVAFIQAYVFVILRVLYRIESN